MRTLNEVLEAYKSVFAGKTIIINGHLLTSDGVNWIVNNTPIDTIENKKKEMLFLIEKIKHLKSCAKQVGINESLIDSTFYMLRDSIDDMLLLVYNDEQMLNIIYSESSCVYIEQITKALGSMIFSKFNKGKIMPEKTTQYRLSKKSIELISGLCKQQNFSFSQNDFYEILPEGMQNFTELITTSTMGGNESGLLK